MRRRGNWLDAERVAVFGDQPRALLGTAHQDWRKSAEQPAYARFVAETSFFPRPRLAGFRAMTSRSWVGLVAGCGLAVLIRTFHARMIAL